jgi:uncharacterized lipoprotein YmbA
MTSARFSFVRASSVSVSTSGTARAMALAAVLVAALAVAGCGSAPPPERLLRMPLTAPATGATTAAPAPPAAPAAATAEAWQLVLPIGLPAYLDHAALLVPAGRAGAGLEPLPGVRWAEPLRDAVPRLLRHDLAQLRGEERLWTAPLPVSLTNAARLRVDVVAFEAEPDGAAVRLVARWSLVRADGGAPTAASAELRVAVVADAVGGRAESLVLAHRQALRALAERIATMR